MPRNGDCRWLFDWQRPCRGLANGGPVWQLVVMRVGRQGRGFVSVSAMQWNRYLPPEALLRSPGQPAERGRQQCSRSLHSSNTTAHSH
ncbi:hypothetical protein PBY51_018062 [Eleginops maclovinus]|uniref:Uncharacterized protein n=1 Tax=Eleginops maclovinus TaxID=56733 RepID=A0AAN8AJX6_ELEMC|nr:hypothetical protein PBY51_018062 [Eleginops maclovinus]